MSNLSYSTKDLILALLMRAGGNYISGEEASKSIGLSRAAVNTAVRTLRSEGTPYKDALRYQAHVSLAFS